MEKTWDAALQRGKEVSVSLTDDDDGLRPALVAALAAADPRPARLVAVVEGVLSGSADFVEAVRAAGEPVWQRSAA